MHHKKSRAQEPQEEDCSGPCCSSGSSGSSAGSSSGRGAGSTTMMDMVDIVKLMEDLERRYKDKTITEKELEFVNMMMRVLG